MQALTRSQILSLAQSLGYTTVKGNMTKAAMIAAFLAEQEAAQETEQEDEDDG